MSLSVAARSMPSSATTGRASRAFVDTLKGSIGYGCQNVHRLLGGFLGAGNSTALVAAVRELMRRGLRIRIMTNDQEAPSSIRSSC